jgi:putative Holliday junction resolvase
MSATPEPHVLLAFDFGTQRIGVAVGQTITKTATPLAILPAKDGTPDWQQVEKLISEWQPDAFVVGIPLNMDGTESAMSARARKFGQRLHGRFGKPCHEMDERLSSFEVRQQLAEHNKKALVKRDPIDSQSARLILESWFSR